MNTKIILRTRYTCDEYDDLILIIKDENEQCAIENISNFIEELKEETNNAYTTDDVLERIGEYYYYEIVDTQKLKVVEA